MMTPAEREATKALYAAAEKAKMAEELRHCQAEVCTTTHTGGPNKGKTFAYVIYEAELHERPEFVFPVAEMARAKAWLTKYAARKGWEVL